MIERIQSVAKTIGCEPRANVYISTERSQCIVCPMTVPTPGFYFESSPPAVLPLDYVCKMLGQLSWDALLACCTTNEPGPKSKSASPAYQASRVATIREFERSFVRVSVEALASVLRVEAAIPSKRARGLFVGRYVSMSRELEDLGEVLIECARSARDLGRIC